MSFAGTLEHFTAEPVDVDALGDMIVAGWIKREEALDEYGEDVVEEEGYLEVLEKLASAYSILKNLETLSRNDAEVHFANRWAERTAKIMKTTKEQAMEGACFWDEIPAAPVELLNRMVEAEIAKDIETRRQLKKMHEHHEHMRKQYAKKTA